MVTQPNDAKITDTSPPEEIVQEAIEPSGSVPSDEVSSPETETSSVEDASDTFQSERIGQAVQQGTAGEIDLRQQKEEKQRRKLADKD